MNNKKEHQQNSPLVVLVKQTTTGISKAAGKTNMATSGPNLLLFLSTLVTIGTLISYRAILSYEAADSYTAHLANAPPPLRSGTTVAGDRPHAPFKFTEVRNDDYEDDGFPEIGNAFLRPASLGGIGSGYFDVTDGDEEEDADAEEEEDDGDQEEKDFDAIAVLKAKTTSIWVKDFKALDPPKEVLIVSATRQDEIDFGSIAKKWELPQTAIGLLKQIHSRTVAFDYNRTTDILSLRHPLKTGGTSFSRMLEEIFEGRTIPGSGFSTWFNRPKFQAAVETHNKPDDPYWTNMAAMYTHSFLRPSNGGRKNKLLDELREMVPALREKRFRLMTIVRRPLDLAASSFYETQCRIGTYAKQRNVKDVKDCPKVNLTDVKQKNIDHWTKKCNSNERLDRRCSSMEAKGFEKVFEHCGSIEKLFEKGTVHNMLHGSLMGDFPRPPELGDDENLVGENLTPTLEDVTTYTLRDLGGLIDYHPESKEDFVWFAVTERFKESMCLFYYRFQVEPVEEKHSL